MIERDIKRVREAENNALSRIEEAERESKEKIEVAKREIRKSIEDQRQSLLEYVENLKKDADKDGKKEAEKILAEYREKIKDIESIDSVKIREVSIKVLEDLFR